MPPKRFNSSAGGRLARWVFPALATICAAPVLALSAFESRIKPILTQYCYDCHGDGMDKGKVTLDHFKSEKEALAADELWWRVLKNVRAGIMPPEKKPRPAAEEVQALETWIKREAFGIDPENPDPGRVTVRRLNRVEYRNTIRDLMGIDFNTDEEFPPDDTGYGFDNIGDVLTISPLLMEKYLQAAEKIVKEAVPTVSRVVPERSIPAKQFSTEEVNAEQMSFYKQARVSSVAKVEHDGEYTVVLDLNVRGAFDFDPGRATVVFKIDDEEKLRREFGWDNKRHELTFAVTWRAGEHRFSIELEPLKKPEEKKTFVELRLNSIKVLGPLDPKFWTKTKNYERFFFQDEPPEGREERRAYAREILERFTRKAFRRPVEGKIVDRLAGIAESVYTSPGKKFEHGIAQAIVAVLASPRFLYRVEESADPAARFANVDEYSLASRLSYFLWSTMPDDELFQLAGRGELRSKLREQVDRMVKSERSRQFVNHFTGQWLQVRDVLGIAINERAVFFRDSDEPRRPPGERRRFGRPPPFEFDFELRRAMQEETQAYFEHVVRENRSVLELIDSDYTFVNERLARHYGLPPVEGKHFRRVTVPEDSPRGGLLTQGALLVVTSNPTRTSPVKRGLFLLDNFLGTPPPPPPPDIPNLEEAEKEFKDREPTLRETLEVHRRQPLCASCHDRMDPLGLAFENFNALGMWREKERGQPIEVSGKLITGETFSSVRELKKILAASRRVDFYRCLTEKLLTYALGRGLEYPDVENVDQIVARLEKDEGRFSTLLMGVIESAPFQKRRNVPVETASEAGQKQVTLTK